MFLLNIITIILNNTDWDIIYFPIIGYYASCMQYTFKEKSFCLFIDFSQWVFEWIANNEWFSGNLNMIEIFTSETEINYK